MRITLRRPRPDSRRITTPNRPARSVQIEARLQAARADALREADRPRFL